MTARSTGRAAWIKLAVMRRALSILSAMACVCGAAFPARAAAPTALPGVTVTAPLLKKIPETVQTFGAPATRGRLARWRTEVCPIVLGMSSERDAYFAQRIRDVAKLAGAPSAPSRCVPDIVVFITTDPDAMVRRLTERAKVLLNGPSRWPVQNSQLVRFAGGKGDPVHLFYLSGDGPVLTGGDQTPAVSNASAAFALSNDLFGPPVYDQGHASRLTPWVDEAFLRVVLVVDARQLLGLDGVQISAYLSLTTLADVNVGDQDFPTIANLFSDRAHGRPPAADLTFWDRAYLGALYKTQSQTSLSMQQSAMADRIAHAVQSQTILPAAGR